MTFTGNRAYRSYRDALTAALGREKPIRAIEINARLNAERLRRGHGIVRGPHRRLWQAVLDDLPDGAIVVGERGEARLVHGECTWAFTFDGWMRPRPRTGRTTVAVITPPTSVAALQHGFVPVVQVSSNGHASLVAAGRVHQ